MLWFIPVIQRTIRYKCFGLWILMEQAGNHCLNHQWRKIYRNNPLSDNIDIWISLVASTQQSLECEGTGALLKTHNVRGPSYLGLTRPISWLVMLWLLASPGHQQPWHWLCEISKSWSYTKKYFNNLQISWLVMLWLLASPGHQQPWHWLCEISKSWSYMKNNFNNLWHVSSEEWN